MCKCSAKEPANNVKLGAAAGGVSKDKEIRSLSETGSMTENGIENAVRNCKSSLVGGYKGMWRGT